MIMTFQTSKCSLKNLRREEWVAELFYSSMYSFLQVMSRRQYWMTIQIKEPSFRTGCCWLMKELSPYLVMLKLRIIGRWPYLNRVSSLKTLIRNKRSYPKKIKYLKIHGNLISSGWISNLHYTKKFCTSKKWNNNTKRTPSSKDCQMLYLTKES